MKKLLFLLFTVLALTMNGQDKNMQATVYYSKAESAYNSGAYDEAVNNLKQAENVLGQTNPKILYLLIQSMNHLCKTSPLRIPEIKTALVKFFQIVDQKNYPYEKYLEVTTIDIDLKELEQKLVEKEKMELPFFQRVRASNDDIMLDSFITIYPNSKYLPELRDRINALEQKKQEQKAAELKRSKEKNKVFQPNDIFSIFSK